MNPDKVIREQVTKLTDLPNIGPAMARDLMAIGIVAPDKLWGRSAHEMYETLCRVTGVRHDPCVLDVFLSITRFMEGNDPKPWWHYTRERKEYLNGRHLLAVTDIFGRTGSFDDLLRQIAGNYISVEVIDPYGGADLNFENETEAYACFQRKMGLNEYIRKVSDTLSTRRFLNQTLLGFSVGASAIWAVSGNLSGFDHTRAVCFYSSQIRQFPDVSPAIKTDLYFSKSEPAYDVEKIMACLSEKANVRCIKTGYMHGFMNQKSQNFDQQGYAEHLKRLKHRQG